MQSILEEFEKRIWEIDACLLFLDQMDQGKVAFCMDPENPAQPDPVQIPDLVKTFKATLFLMLYNLMESTVTNAVEAIFDELEQKAVAFDQCSDQIRMVVLKNLKQHNAEKLYGLVREIAVDIVTKTFESKNVVSGNVDARKIAEIARKYGFNSPTSRGDRLLTIKTQRNDLAHGAKSFSEVGRSYSMKDIAALKDDVVTYLREMINHVGAYLDGQHYYKQAAATGS